MSVMGTVLPPPFCAPCIRIACLTVPAPPWASTIRHFAPSDPNLHYAALQALALAAGDDLAIGDVLEFKFGSELQSIQFLGHVTAFRPYGSLDLHASPNTVVGYNYATSLPNTAE